MKQWNELTHQEKQFAFNKEINATLQAVTEAGADLFPELSEYIDKAAAEMENMRTPWFFAETLYEMIPFTICKIALRYAKTCLYARPGEPSIIRGIIQ